MIDVRVGFIVNWLELAGQKESPSLSLGLFLVEVGFSLREDLLKL